MGNYNDLNYSESKNLFERDEQLWVDAVRGGNKDAFRNIFNRYYEPLICFAFRYTNCRADAEEAVQNVFLWIWDQKENWYVKGSLKTYLFRAVKYKCLDLIRQEDTKKKYIREYIRDQRETEPSQQEAGRSIDETEFKKKTKKAIEELPERAKLIYKMSRLEGLTYREISDVLEISPKTVESQMSRALHILRTRLSKYLGLLVIVKKVTDFLF